MINSGNTCNFKRNVGRETNYALEMGAKERRNGWGVVYIFASGDSYGKGDNVNYQAYPKSRFVMTVGAVKVKEVSDGNKNHDSATHPLDVLHEWIIGVCGSTRWGLR